MDVLLFFLCLNGDLLDSMLFHAWPLEKLPNFSPKWLYHFTVSPAECGHVHASASLVMLVIVALLIIAAIVVSVKGSLTLVIICAFQLPIDFKQLLSFAS